MAGVVNTTYTFTATDTITSTKMNNIIDETVFTSDAIVSDNTTLEVSGGKLRVASGGITASELASNSVTTSKIGDGQVTTAKLSSGKPVWSNWTSASPYTSTLTLGDGRTSTTEGDTSILFRSGDPAENISYDASIKRESGKDGDLIIDNTVEDTSVETNGQIKFAINGSDKVVIENDGKITHGTAPIPVPSGSAPIYGCRAWAKLNPFVGSIRTGAYKTGNYSRTNTETTVTIVDHGLKTNDKIRLDFTSGTSGTATDGLYTVTSSANANEFVVNHTGASTTGSVTAQFVAIQGSGNVSTASWYDSGENRIVLNFFSEMPNDDYATIVTGQHYPSAWSTTANEDTLGTTQLNTVYQAHIYMSQHNRFINVAIIG
jgi:hypothetical protein